MADPDRMASLTLICLARQFMGYLNSRRRLRRDMILANRRIRAQRRRRYFEMMLRMENDVLAFLLSNRTINRSAPNGRLPLRTHRNVRTSSSTLQNPSNRNQELNPFLTSKNIVKILEVPNEQRYLLTIMEMCQEMDFRGFTAIYIFENIIKCTLFKGHESNEQISFSVSEVPHMCECFLVNKNGKIGCGLYRVFTDILGEETVSQLGFHTRTFHEIILTFLNSAGHTITNNESTNLSQILETFVDFLTDLITE